MKTPLWKATGNLAMVMALAAVMTFFLLWGIHGYALPDVTAQVPSLQQTQAQTDPVLPAWVANQVFTQPYTSSETIIWSIPSCNVVITLPKGLIGDDRKTWTTVFTFTTEPQQTFPEPLHSIDYFFSLDGSTSQELPSSQDLAVMEPQGPPSFNPGMAPLIEWSYQDADLEEIQESSLHLYREWGLVGDQYWKVQTGWVDTKNKKAYASLEALDTFGFGGYRERLYLPLIVNAVSSE